MALDDIAKGVALFPWGKLVAATADEIKSLGPQAARVKALLSFLPNISDDAASLGRNVERATRTRAGLDLVNDMQDFASDSGLAAGRGLQMTKAFNEAYNAAGRGISKFPAADAAWVEAASDLLVPKYGRAGLPGRQAYDTFIAPMATARTFDIVSPNAPPEFVSIARDLGERGLITSPGKLSIARKISELPPHLRDVYMNLLGEGTDPVELLAAMKLLG